MSAITSLFRTLFVDKERIEHMHNLQEEENSRVTALTDTYKAKVMGNIAIVPCNCTLGKDVVSDLELVKAYKDDADHTAFVTMLCKIHLLGAREYMLQLVSNPIRDMDLLTTRQGIIKHMASTRPAALAILTEMRECEPDIIWLYDLCGTESEALYDLVYFNIIFLRYLNHQPHALTANNLYRIIVSPIVGIATPILTIVVPYLVVRLKYGFNLPFATYIRLVMMSMTGVNSIMSSNSVLDKLKYVSLAFTVLFYFQGMFQSIEISKTVYKITKILVTKMNNVVKFVQLGSQLQDLLWKPDICSAFFPDARTLSLSPKLHYYKDQVLQPFSLFSNFGVQLKNFKHFPFETLIPFINRMYMVDALSAIGGLVVDRRMTYVTYVTDSDVPVLQIANMWHPCLLFENTVKNSVQMGGSAQNNIILTGPNAGGKSTIIKSILMNVMLSQTIGLCSADSCVITPFKCITSQIHIPDCKGKESLFEAEMYRSRDNLQMLKSLAAKEFSIIAMDEIFNSTNPIEGMSGAYAIAKAMAGCPTSISIITTHYIYLSRLAKELPNKFANYKMNVRINKDKDNDIEYPYKMSKGVSKQYIALELLRKNGFDDEIIADALDVKAKLLSK